MDGLFCGQNNTDFYTVPLGGGETKSGKSKCGTESCGPVKLPWRNEDSRSWQTGKTGEASHTDAKECHKKATECKSRGTGKSPTSIDRVDRGRPLEVKR